MTEHIDRDALRKLTGRSGDEELVSYTLLLSEALDQAEARIKAVRELCDAREAPDQWPPRNRLHGGALMPASLMVRDIRRALDGDSTNRK